MAAIYIAKVLVCDPVDPACGDLLLSNGILAVCKFKMSKGELLKEIQNYDGIIVRSDTQVSAEIINAGQRLKVIGRAGAGVDNIDVSAATAKKIVVLNTPGANAISACELTCSMITNLARNVVPAAASLKAGRWDRKLYTGSEVFGKTLAVIGLGRIGKEVAIRMQSFGMKTIGFDPLVSAEEAAKFNVQKMELDEIWPNADYVTVHTPLIPQTKYLINKNVFAKCKNGVRVVNVARGGIVHEGDLLDAITSGQCGGAGIDVFEEEPPKNGVAMKLIQSDRVIATPHLGASTIEAQKRVAVDVAEQIIALTGKSKKYTTLSGVVNPVVLQCVI